MEKLTFRNLKADEIEIRVGQESKNKDKFSLLLYKNARVDMSLLDEIVGQGNWQREHKILGDDIYCRVGIYNKDRNEWVWFEDAGSSGNVEPEKSKATSSFKRACVSVGIGRELYSAPKIWINTTENNQPKGENYSVQSIGYNEKREITKLTIANDKTGEIVYSYPKGAKVSQNGAKQPKNDIREDLQAPDTITEEDLKQIELYLATIKGNQMKEYAFNEYLTKTFNVYHADKLNFQQGRTVADFCRKKLNG